MSEDVMQAMGTVLTNKYAEGYPGKRYYGGCEHVDVVERLAINRVKNLFNAQFANVQPHSGAQANTAVFFSLLQPGDTIMGMNLSHGGHLTHGSPVSISGKWFKVASYGVDKQTGRIDYDQVESIALKERPKLIIAGASAYTRTLDFKAFAEIARKTGATFMVDMAHIAGLVATEHHPSPLPHADVVTSTTHKTLRGPRGGVILSNDELQIKKMNKAIFPGIQGGPMMHIISAKAVAFKEAMQDRFNDYINQVVVNASTLAKTLKDEGCELVAGGTDNHLILLDVRPCGLTGKMAEEYLDESGITTNKNTIPFDPESPFITSGIRIGTSALTTRGMKEKEMEIIGHIIANVLKSQGETKIIEESKGIVNDLCSKFPLFAYDQPDSIKVKA